MPDTGGARPDPNAPDSPHPDWKHLHLWQMQPVRDVLLAAAIFGILYLGYRISIVTVPLMLALLLAYLLEPIVHWMTKSGRIKRSAAAGSLIAAVLIVIVVPLVIGAGYAAVSAVGFAQDASRNVVLLDQAISAKESADRAAALQKLPNKAWRRAADYLTQVTKEQKEEGHTVSPTVAAIGQVKEWVVANSGDLATLAAKRAIQVVTATVRTITTIGFLFFAAFLTAFFFFFISTNYRQVLDFGEKLIPEAQRDRTIHLLTQFDDVIAGFIRGRLTIAMIQAVIFSIGYFLIGTPAALLVGFGVGILSIVPYLALVGIPISMLLMALDPASGFRGTWWWILIAPVAWYFIGQAIDDYILTPKIQGERTGLDTPTVLFVVLAGGALAGIYGLLIAIPVGACLKILLHEVVRPKFDAWISGRAEDPLPLGRGE